MLALIAAAITLGPFDEAAQTAYDALQARLSKANSAKATLEITNFGRVDTYAFRFLRPNFAKIVSPESAIYQTGTQFFDYDPLYKQYFIKSCPATGLPGGTSFSLGGISGLESLGFSNEPPLVPSSLAKKAFAGTPAQAILLKSKTDPALKATIWVDPKTGLPIGWDYYLREFKASGRIKGLILDTPLTPADFDWKPPAGAKKIG